MIIHCLEYIHRGLPYMTCSEYIYICIRTNVFIEQGHRSAADHWQCCGIINYFSFVEVIFLKEILSGLHKLPAFFAGMEFKGTAPYCPGSLTVFTDNHFLACFHRSCSRLVNCSNQHACHSAAGHSCYFVKDLHASPKPEAVFQAQQPEVPVHIWA